MCGVFMADIISKNNMLMNYPTYFDNNRFWGYLNPPNKQINYKAICELFDLENCKLFYFVRDIWSFHLYVLYVYMLSYSNYIRVSFYFIFELVQ